MRSCRLSFELETQSNSRMIEVDGYRLWDFVQIGYACIQINVGGTHERARRQTARAPGDYVLYYVEPGRGFEMQKSATRPIRTILCECNKASEAFARPTNEELKSNFCYSQFHGRPDPNLHIFTGGRGTGGDGREVCRPQTAHTFYVLLSYGDLNLDADGREF